MELSILNWAQNHYQQKMLNKAFEERFMYYIRTEKIDRYLDLAKDQGTVDESQLIKILVLHKKQRHAIPLAIEEQFFVEELKKSLLKSLRKYEKKPLPEFIEDGWNMKEASLSNKEKVLLEEQRKI